MPFSAGHVTVSIDRNANEVYAFLSNAENFVKWAPGFCLAIKPGADKNTWVIDTVAGPGSVRFVEKNPFLIMDHYVHVEPNTDVYMPMRVLVNGEGCEVMITVFRMPGVTDEEYALDKATVLQDLHNLKRMMEQTASKR